MLELIIAFIKHLMRLAANLACSIHTQIRALLSSFSPKQSITLNQKRYTIQRKLGEGGFSFVYLVKSSTGSLFALKRIRIALPEQCDRLANEIKSHTVISPHIVKLVDHEIVMDGRRMLEGLLLLPFYASGTVQDLIDRNKKEGRRTDLYTLLKIAIDVCVGLTAFHDCDLAFRDLKPANILLSPNDPTTAVLMDLGSVAKASLSITSRKEGLELQDLCAETVTAPYRPPEFFDPPSTIEIDERSDAWSLGCTLFAIAFGESPFDGSATAAVNGRFTFPDNSFGNAFKDIVTAALHTDIQQRASVREIHRRCEMLIYTTSSSSPV